MPQQTINLGTTSNDGTGDTLRSGGGKINSNFTENYTSINGLSSALTTLEGTVNTKRGNTATANTLTYAAIVNLDMAAITGTYQTLTLTGNLTLTTSNRGIGREVSIRLISDASSRNLTFPVGWKFLGAARPTSIAASKVAILSITFFDETDADAVCAYSVEV